MKCHQYETRFTKNQKSKYQPHHRVPQPRWLSTQGQIQRMNGRHFLGDQHAQLRLSQFSQSQRTSLKYKKIVQLVRIRSFERIINTEWVHI